MENESAIWVREAGPVSRMFEFRISAPVHYLTACLIFKDSAPFLDEWIRFHLTVGFEHLYLYDNDSSDDCESIIRPFVKRRQVTLRNWPGIGQQRNVFQNCLDTYRRSARWIAFIDDDEFLYPPPGKQPAGNPTEI